MIIKNPARMRQDEDGQWWYIMREPWDEDHPRGTRTRCEIFHCHVCGEDFVGKPNRHQGTNRNAHCSKLCARRCTESDCWVAASNYARREAAKGDTAPRWRGGRRVVRGGYVEIWMPDHPSLVGTQRKYVREHRLVMEKALGRLLAPDETVHHKNGVKDDNRIENLELWTSMHPAGQRVIERSPEPHCPTCTCYLHSR